MDVALEEEFADSLLATAAFDAVAELFAASFVSEDDAGAAESDEESEAAASDFALDFELLLAFSARKSVT